MEKLWTTNEVSQFLGINEIDVEELVRQGKLTGYRLGGQFLRFRPSQVEELKRTIRFRANPVKTGRPSSSAWSRMRDLVYFYDFYVVSATCLAALIIYLLVSG